MPRILENTKELNRSIKKLRKAISQSSDIEILRLWSFPLKSKKHNYETFISGKLGIGVPTECWNGRFPHLFTLSLKNSVLHPEVEINIPIKLNRQVAGVYVYVQAEDETYLCSRGLFHHVKKAEALSFFKNSIMNVRDGKKKELTPVIRIAKLDSESIIDDIVEFVILVKKLKKKNV